MRGAWAYPPIAFPLCADSSIPHLQNRDQGDAYIQAAGGALIKARVTDPGNNLIWKGTPRNI
jgi:hypothetical protein